MVKFSRLDEALLEAIDFGLAVPGEIVRETIYERLETAYGIKREEIPEKLPVFHQALQELVRSVAKVIERVIAKNLYIRLGQSFVNHENWTLIQYVNHLKEVRSNA
jgi:plasmid maintenance system antidote protein VapI